MTDGSIGDSAARSDGEPKPAVPPISLRKGGGAIRGMGEKFCRQLSNQHRLDVGARRQRPRAFGLWGPALLDLQAMVSQ